jgi:hypothetical protein
MTDPKTQKKGFGAFVGREHEAHDVREAAEQAETAKHARDAAVKSDAATTPVKPS